MATCLPLADDTGKQTALSSLVVHFMFAVSAFLFAAVCPATATEPSVVFNQAYTDLTSGQYENAVEKFTRAIESEGLRDEDLSRALMGRASAYGALGRHQLEIADYEAVVSIEPRSASAFNGRGVAHKRLGQYERALEDFDTAIRLDPHQDIYLLNRGGVYVELKRFVEAIRDLDTAIEIMPSNGLFWYSRGLIHEERGDLDRAKADFKQALTLSPEYPPIRMKANRYNIPP